MEGMSKQQQRVYDFIWQYREEHNYCASIEDVAGGLGLSNSTVATYVENLKAKGYITSEYGIPRSLAVTSKDGKDE